MESLPGGGSCWLSDDSRLPGAHCTTSYSKEDAFANGTEETPRLPESHQPPAFWEGVLGRTLGTDFKSDPLCVLERDSLP